MTLNVRVFGNRDDFYTENRHVPGTFSKNPSRLPNTMCETLKMQSIPILAGRCTLEDVNKSADEFIDYFCSMVYELTPHEFTASMQQKYYKHVKENLKLNEFVVVSDFSENFTFVMQEAVQAYHWANAQCTIHPFCIYSRDENSGELLCNSLVMIAESLHHDITSVYLFQNRLLSYMKTKFNSMKKIYFWPIQKQEQNLHLVSNSTNTRNRGGMAFLCLLSWKRAV